MGRGLVRRIGQRVLLAVFGLVLSLLILELGLRLAGFTISLPSLISNLARPDEKVYRILCLGESTTQIGGGNPWPEQLEAILNNQSKTQKFKVYNLGVAGTTTAFIVSAIDEDVARYRPDMVISMMGINDAKGPPFRYEDNLFTKLALFLSDLRVVKLWRWINEALENRKAAELKYRALSEEDLRLSQLYLEKVISLKAARGWNETGFQEARDAVYKAIELDPRNENILFTFIELIGDKEATSNETERLELLNEAAVALEKFREYNPMSYNVNSKLLEVYLELNRSEDAERVYVDYTGKLSKTDPDYFSSLMDLAHVYYLMGNPQKEEETYRKAGWFLSFDNQRYLVARGEFGSLINDAPVNRLFFFAAGFSVMGGFQSDEITSYHYKVLASKLNAKGITYLAMQYPQMDISIIQDRLDNSSQVIYVSNKENFEAALKLRPYDYYFTDRFGGVFGHTTALGSRLIAQSAAEAILKRLNITG